MKAKLPSSALMPLFALTNDPKKPILKISISRNIQDDVTENIKDQEKDFLKDIGSDNEIEFDGHYKPDENELLYIDNFLISNKIVNGKSIDIKNPNIEIVKEMIKVIKEPYSCSEELKIGKTPLDSIKSIFSGYISENGKIRILMQVFNNSHIISKKGWLALFYDKNIFTGIDPNNLLMLDNKLTAIIDGDKIKFKKFYYLKHIFDMSIFFREATVEDLNSFIGLPGIHIQDAKKFIDSSDTQIRQKIWLMQESNAFNILNSCPITDIVTAAKEIGINLNIIKHQDADCIQMPIAKKEIMKFLSFLEESIYKGRLTNTPYISNSKRRFS